ncbi:MAG: hypothetical protein PWR10_1917 [Halanaerobiales bacterium]|nr:hypothetical protein [Halanaerobiales bacterium]
MRRRKNELEKEITEIDSAIKMLEIKELELEALKLQEEISDLKNDI